MLILIILLILILWKILKFNNESLKKSSDGFDEHRNKVKEDKKENEELPLSKNVDLNVYINK